MPRILLIDDDEHLAPPLATYLKRFDFELAWAARPSLGLAMLRDERFDAAILDVMLPEMDGFELLRTIRHGGGAAATVPLIMLTARGELPDKVAGLELGADDYLAKPCELRELLARIRVVLRRSAPAAQQVPAPAPAAASPQPAAPDRSKVRFGTKWLDHDAQALRDDEGNEHPLTASEYGLLKVFAANPKRVLSRDRLLELANARDAEAFDRAIDLRIMRIRRKIEPDPARPSVIRTVRGGGYLFSPTGETSSVD